MATLHPSDHLLIVSTCIRRAPVRTQAAAATFTRPSLEFNPIMEGATLQQLRNLRARMLLYMMMGAILVQKLPPINLRALLNLPVDILVAVIMCSLTGESTNFGSGVVTSICRMR
jgi:hypothetical protein